MSLFNKHNNSYRSASRIFRKDEAGVTLIQFALVLPLLFLFLIGIMDLARFMTIKSILDKASQNALNVATKVSDLDRQIASLSPSDEKYQAFVQARKLAFDTGAILATNTMLTDCNTPSSARLLCATTTDNFSTTDPTTGLPYTTKYSSNLALLRPGDRADFQDSSGHITTVYHPTVKPGDSSLPPKDLMHSHPLVAEMRAEINMFLPLFGNKIIISRATGYREDIPDFSTFSSTTKTVVTTSTTSTVKTTTTVTTTTTGWVCDLAGSWGKCLAASERATKPFLPNNLVDSGSTTNPPTCNCRSPTSGAIF